MHSSSTTIDGLMLFQSPKFTPYTERGGGLKPFKKCAPNRQSSKLICLIHFDTAYMAIFVERHPRPSKRQLLQTATNTDKHPFICCFRKPLPPQIRSFPPQFHGDNVMI